MLRKSCCSLGLCFVIEGDTVVVQVEDKIRIEYMPPIIARRLFIFLDNSLTFAQGDYIRFAFILLKL